MAGNRLVPVYYTKIQICSHIYAGQFSAQMIKSRLLIKNRMQKLWKTLMIAWCHGNVECACHQLDGKFSNRSRNEIISYVTRAAMEKAHYNDIIMGAIASQITSLTIVYSTVYSDADQRKHQSSASLAFVWGIHRGPVNSPHKRPVKRKMFPSDDVIMNLW